MATAKVYIPVNEVRFNDNCNGVNIDPNFESTYTDKEGNEVPVDDADFDVELSVNQVVELVDQAQENGDLTKSNVKRILTTLMEDEQFSEFIISTALKTAYDQTEGAERAVMNAARLTWKSICEYNF